MTNREQMREQIRSMRGEYIDEVVYTYEFYGRTIEIVGYGFENYPEAEFYRVRDNGVHVIALDGNTPYTAALRAQQATHDTLYLDVMDAVDGKEFSW